MIFLKPKKMLKMVLKLVYIYILIAKHASMVSTEWLTSN